MSEKTYRFRVRSDLVEGQAIDAAGKRDSVVNAMLKYRGGVLTCTKDPHHVGWYFGVPETTRAPRVASKWCWHESWLTQFAVKPRKPVETLRSVQEKLRQANETVDDLISFNNDLRCILNITHDKEQGQIADLQRLVRSLTDQNVRLTTQLYDIKECVRRIG